MFVHFLGRNQPSWQYHQLVDDIVNLISWRYRQPLLKKSISAHLLLTSDRKVIKITGFCISIVFFQWSRQFFLGMWIHLFSFYAFTTPVHMSFESLSLECKVFSEMLKWGFSLNFVVASSEIGGDEFDMILWTFRVWSIYLGEFHRLWCLWATCRDPYWAIFE